MIYNICKGCNYSNGIIVGSPHTGKTEQTYKVKFSRSCLALHGIQKCDGDWNKLFGWSYGYHHTNSLRLAWKSLNGKIRIGWYIYENGAVKYDGFASVIPDTEIEMYIRHDTEKKVAVFVCGDKSVTVNYSKRPSWGYTLNPYFGGDCSAPVNMQIELI